MITTKSGYFGDGYIADVDTKANAAFIVTACNNHDKLIEALKSARDVLVMATLIDKSDTCNNEVNAIDELLNQLNTK